LENFNSIMFIIVLSFIIICFILTFVSFFSSKRRNKFFSSQIKSLKNTLDFSKDDIEDLSSTMAGISIRSRKKVLDEHEDSLTDLSNREANIKKGYVKTMAKAVKEGLGEDTIYCRYCGANIESDSIFCKKCGKKQ